MRGVLGTVVPRSSSLDLPRVARGDPLGALIQSLRDGTAQPLSMLEPGGNIPHRLYELAQECTRWSPSERPSFDEIASRLREPSLMLEICGDQR